MAREKKEKLSLDELLEQALVKEEDYPYDVPSNWVWTKLKYVVKVNPSKKNVKEIDDITEVSFIPMSNISDIEGKIIEEQVKLLGEVKKGYTNFQQGDVLFAKITPCMENGKSAIVGELINNLGYGSTEFHVLRPSKTILKEFVYYLVRAEWFREEAKRNMSGSVGQQRVPKQFLEEYNISLPPLEEQKRIVERIETLFKKLDIAKELVQNALNSFEKRKAAILHKAFTGELTAKWREEKGVSLDGWEEKSLEEVCTINPRKINVKEIDDSTQVTFVPMPAVSDILGIIQDPLSKSLGEVKKGYTNFCEGDVLFAKITPCMENGKAAVVGKLINDIGYGSTEFHVIRCNESLYNRFIYHLVRWQFFRDKAKESMTGAVGQQRVPKSYLEKYVLKMPSLEEQKEIVSIIDRLLDELQRADELYDIVNKIDLMKKSILARAFRGELGTNNPEEESAESLLREILVKNLS